MRHGGVAACFLRESGYNAANCPHIATLLNKRIYLGYCEVDLQVSFT